jgi:hypothetical protein
MVVMAISPYEKQPVGDLELIAIRGPYTPANTFPQRFEGHQRSSILPLMAARPRAFAASHK